MMAASKTEDYQLLGEVLDQDLKELGYSREDLSVELFASDKQHVLDLYCSRGKNCCYKSYWPAFGMAYGNPRVSEQGKSLGQGGPGTFSYVSVFPRLGSPWGQRLLANTPGQADYQLCPTTG